MSVGSLAVFDEIAAEEESLVVQTCGHTSGKIQKTKQYLGKR